MDGGTNGARMRAAVVIDDNLLAEAQRLTGLDERTDLIREALTALIERERGRDSQTADAAREGIFPLTTALERIDAFRQLPDDWDSYGGIRPTGQATLVALGVLLALWREGVLASLDVLDVVPVPTGGIQFEWQGQPGAVEIEVSHAGAVSWLVERPDGTVDASPDAAAGSLDVVVDHVKRLVA